MVDSTGVTQQSDPDPNGIKVWVFFGKNIEKQHLCRDDKNYYYFCKSNNPVINLIVDPKIMIKVSTNMNM